MRAAGRIFRLRMDIVAIEPCENRVRGVVIPTGNTVRVVRNPCVGDDRLADVIWDEKPMVVFRRDLRNLAKEVGAKAASQSNKRS